MSANPCERCERPVEDARVCSLCGRDAERALGNVPWLASELDLTISRQARLSAQSDGGRSAETPVPFHVHAGEARDELRNILVGWCKLYAEDARGDYPEDTLDAMSRYLLKRVEWFRHHETAALFVDEITHAVRTVTRLVDAPENRTTFAVGPCPELDATATPCPGEVRAFIPASEHGMARMECAVCGTQYATWQWLRAGKRITERLETEPRQERQAQRREQAPSPIATTQHPCGCVSTFNLRQWRGGWAIVCGQHKGREASYSEKARSEQGSPIGIGDQSKEQEHA